MPEPDAEAAGATARDAGSRATITPETTPLDAARLDAARLEAAAARPPRERGRTSIADAASTRIAEIAAREVPGVRTASMPMGHLMAALPGVTGSLPRASISTAGSRARVEMSIGVHWPYPLPAVAEHVHDRVSERLATLTGLTIDRVDVTVVDIALPETRERIVQ